MNDVVVVWLQFLACLLLVGYAGVRLTVYGDAIADKTGLGGNWIGFLLIGIVTSMPDLANGLSAVTLADAPDLAVGAIFGACIFNLAIIVILDLLYRQGSVFSSASQGHILSAAFGIVMIGFSGLSMNLALNREEPALGHIGIFSLVILVLYLVSVYTVFNYESRQVKEYTEQEPDAYPGLSLGVVIARYVAAAVVVIVTGIFLPLIAKEAASLMHWQESFVGTLLVAFITTLPEIIVAVTAVRIDALDMAIGNIFGSNLFNMAILAIEDVVYKPGPLFSKIAPVHAVSVMTSLIMTGFAITGLFFRPEKRLLKMVGWISWMLLSLLLINSYFLFINGRAA
ncbi:sodium:calcium antiporter [Candidatus Methylobacter oryzae]|uniref:Sodium:calcium antiporter n=1 Tax=Candidatus Methylobacter oryzae TaxID=2497749 RepID=A0ABY3C4Y3_9GAMM|nr:sodium:calcium antiporter [Candidatus Methylobacter oryzae]